MSMLELSRSHEKVGILARVEALAGPLCAAVLTGLLAGVRVPLPYTPIPLTGQVFGVLLAGYCLGSSRGAFSQALYLAIGLAGVPWFSGWSALSPAAFASAPTAGYLFGFLPAAWLVGALSPRPGADASPPRLMAAFLPGIAVIYLFGSVWMALLFGFSWGEIIKLSVYPFVVFDLLKALLAVVMVGSFTALGNRR